MTFISIIIASAGMTLGLAGPEGAHACKDDCSKACCETSEASHSCAMCEDMAEGESCAMCTAHADAKKGMSDHGHAHEAMHQSMTKIDSAEYGNAAWPAHNKGEGLYAKDFQGKMLPVALGTETWISKEVKTEGKVVVLDFWATWCPPCRAAMPILDQLQKDNKDTLAVLAIGGQRENESTVREYLESHEESISNLFDADQSVYSKFESKGIPLVVVMSTDGVVRWIGNPHDKNFKKAVAQVIKVDPMVNAQG